MNYYIRIFLVYGSIIFVAYVLSPLGTDYDELNQLFNCINNPTYCPLEINVDNYSLILRFFFKCSLWGFSLTALQLVIITFAFSQLYYISKKESLNSVFVIVVFFLAFLKDYYLNALEQALALSFFLFSLNIKRYENIIISISSWTHVSSVLLFFKNITYKNVYHLTYLIILVNLGLFLVYEETLFSYVIVLFESTGISKINYYLVSRSVNENYLPLFAKTLFFLIALNSRYIQNSPHKFVYILTFLLYSLLLNIDILANRILAVGKIFEILAFASLLTRPYKSFIWLLSGVYLLTMMYINFL